MLKLVEYLREKEMERELGRRRILDFRDIWPF
jgi:hypothetical protein